MNRYERYKDSGIPWLGEVPEHWEIKPLKFSINNISHKVESQLSNLRYFGLENIESFTGRLLLDIELESEGIANEFQENDVLFGKLRPYLAKVHLSRLNGLVSTEALVFRASNAVNPKFLFYFCVSSDFIDAVNGTTFGSKMPRASWDNIGNFRMLIPSLKEQTAIAHYLDTKLGEIDALIDKQQTLLEKLAEQRTAVITHTVTKGLNPAAPMKNSGVEWLGDVPAHWEVKRLKFLGDIVLGLTYSPENITNEDNGTLVLRSSNIQNGKLVYEDNVFVNSDIPKRMVTTDKDILICSRNGSRSLIGKCALIEKDGLNQTFGAFMTVYRTPYRKFVYYSLNSEIFKSQLGLFLTSTINQLTTQVLGNFNIAFPPLEEQNSITDYLDQETAKIDRLCDTVNQTIGRLKEYRTALITQAVTGKIKVTNE